MAYEVNGKSFESDEEGYLVDIASWNEELANLIAKDEEIEMTEEHWEVVNFLRDYYNEYQIAPAVRVLIKAVKKKMGAALARLAQEDPSFRVASDDESGQTIIKGMGELHLDILVDRMKREFKVEANIGAPQVAYRETITKPSDVDYTHKKQSGGAGQPTERAGSIE